MLASTSPRRAALLKDAGVRFEVRGPGVDDAAEAAVQGELRARGGTPEAVVRRLAVLKLLATLPEVEPARVVLAADTVVVHAGRVLGKPRDRDHAREVLASLRGEVHHALSGVAARDAEGRLHLTTVATEIRCDDFTPETLEAYLDTGAWVGKAGGYGVQDEVSAPLIQSVQGSRSNAIGLPLEWVLHTLAG